MIQLIKPISDHPVLGFKRGIRLKSIQFVDFDLQEARVVWEEVHLDVNDAVIEDPTVPVRQMVSPLSNNNKVDNNGVVITFESVQSANAILTDESESDYNTRVKGLYNDALSAGNPEFDFYVSVILNLQKIGQAVVLLDSLDRFNRV